MVGLFSTFQQNYNVTVGNMTVIDDMSEAVRGEKVEGNVMKKEERGSHNCFSTKAKF
jgi:hypothetical protein